MNVDHLFLDQDGVPTLVEVKRSTDSRVRREVVGQMLDYAANAVLHWPMGTIQAAFEETCRGRHLDPAEVLAQFLPSQESDGAVDPAAFWKKVQENLVQKKIRLLFVADEIPRELRRIVEFLNEDMENAEVLAVQLKQFVGDSGVKTLIPQVMGHTNRSESRKSSGGAPIRKWDEESFMEAASDEGTPHTPEICRRLVEWFRDHGRTVDWMPGKPHFAHFDAAVGADDQEMWILSVWADGRAILYVKMIENDFLRAEFRRRIDAVKGIKLGAAEKEPRLEPSIEPLADPEAWGQFTGALGGTERGRS